MQQRIEVLQGELAEEVLDLSVGGGAIKVKITGQSRIKSLELNPELLKEPKETLEQILISGMQEAFDTAGKHKEKRLQAISEGMDIPGLFA